MSRGGIVEAEGARPRYPALDALRAVAALCVIVYHAVLLNGIGIPQVAKVFVYRFGLAVPLFYALSAFSLAVGYHGRLRGGDALIRYALRRYFRIAPLFYVLVPIWIAVVWFRSGQTTSPFTVFANLTFLFGFMPGLHESVVWAGWSIGVEMIFYALLPLVFLASRGVGSSLALYAVSLVVAVAFQAWIGPDGSYGYMNIVTHLPHFMAGLAAFHIHRSGLLDGRNRLRAALLPMGLSIWALMAGFRISHPVVRGVDVEQYLVALAFPCVILSQLKRPSTLLANRVVLFLGRRSFSLYLLHPLVIVATAPLAAAMTAAHGTAVTVVAVVAMIILLTVVAASITYPLIEAPFMRIGGRVATCLLYDRIATSPPALGERHDGRHHQPRRGDHRRGA